jgi:hypothetical protein
MERTGSGSGSWNKGTGAGGGSENDEDEDEDEDHYRCNNSEIDTLFLERYHSSFALSLHFI